MYLVYFIEGESKVKLHGCTLVVPFSSFLQRGTSLVTSCLFHLMTKLFQRGYLPLCGAIYMYKNHEKNLCKISFQTSPLKTTANGQSDSSFLWCSKFTPVVIFWPYCIQKGQNSIECYRVDRHQQGRHMWKWQSSSVPIYFKVKYYVVWIHHNALALFQRRHWY